jgi:hypothetical protein
MKFKLFNDFISEGNRPISKDNTETIIVDNVKYYLIDVNIYTKILDIAQAAIIGDEWDDINLITLIHRSLQQGSIHGKHSDSPSNLKKTYKLAFRSSLGSVPPTRRDLQDLHSFKAVYLVGLRIESELFKRINLKDIEKIVEENKLLVSYTETKTEPMFGTSSRNFIELFLYPPSARGEVKGSQFGF